MKLRREAAILKKKSFNEYDQERPYRHRPPPPPSTPSRCRRFPMALGDRDLSRADQDLCRTDHARRTDADVHALGAVDHGIDVAGGQC